MKNTTPDKPFPPDGTYVFMLTQRKDPDTKALRMYFENAEYACEMTFQPATPPVAKMKWKSQGSSAEGGIYNLSWRCRLEVNRGQLSFSENQEVEDLKP